MSIQGYYIVFCAVIGGLASYFGADYLRNSATALAAMIDIFSILAGVLVAVISIVGDPSMLLPGSWRLGYEHANEMQKKIANFSHLFFSYIISLILIVICMVVNDNYSNGFDFFFSALAFSSAFSFMLSIPLPYGLMAIQKERMREEIRARKKRSNEDGGSGS